MGRGHLRISWVLGVAAATTVGCIINDVDDTESSPDQVVSGGDPSIGLKSTVFIEGGCAAAKVGPRHLLVGARCVFNNAKLNAGSTITFTPALASETVKPDTNTIRAKDAGPADASSSSPSDAGSPSQDGGTVADAGTAPPPPPSGSGTRQGVIQDVQIHTSYKSKCEGDACKLATLGASNAADVAVILLKDEIANIPTIPVDLDVVGETDPLYALSGGCERLDGKPGDLKATKMIAVPARAVNHDGSPYRTAPALTSRLGSRYVVTAGRAWQKDAPGLCKADIGMPLFRGSGAAVAGITSSYSSADESALTAVTIHHTRVDEKLGYGIGGWLKPLGVETTHSCSTTTEGCTKKTYDGPMPKGSTDPLEGSGDGGTVKPPPDRDAAAGDDSGVRPPDDEPKGPREERLPDNDDDDEYGSGDDDDYSDAAIPRKKKKKQEGGCAAAPGPIPAGGLSFGFGVAAVLAALRRRRRA